MQPIRRFFDWLGSFFERLAQKEDVVLNDIVAANAERDTQEDQAIIGSAPSPPVAH
jgi:hypothetical protein